MKKYRIKTEQEFINEFGEGWKKCVGWNTSNHMDYLLGRQLIASCSRLDGWFINDKMITDKPLPKFKQPIKFNY
jgi:hypothetical protein